MENLPRHIAIIMDGNGRWARQRGFPRVMGHREGIKAVRRVVEAAASLNLEVLTLFAFSVENWNRSPKEVDALMNMLPEFLKKESESYNLMLILVPGPGSYRIVSEFGDTDFPVVKGRVV